MYVDIVISNAFNLNRHFLLFFPTLQFYISAQKESGTRWYKYGRASKLVSLKSLAILNFTLKLL